MADRIARYGIVGAAVILGLLGCAGAVVEQPKPNDPLVQARIEAPPTKAATPTPAVAVASATAPAILADEVDAGSIARPTLLGVLSGGVGRFLQHLRVEAHRERGRFIGWRLVDLFPQDPEMQRGVLRAGDTVMSANGQSIERPEQFKNVWDSLATERQLVLVVQRGGKQSQLRYRIVD